MMMAWPCLRRYELRYWARLAWAFSTLGLASEEAYHQRLARLMQERQQQLQRLTPAAGAVAAAQRPSRLQQRTVVSYTGKLQVC
ncbi:hypothetical protein HaLaN_01024 [Haematococcus lacustris]|uniref:Uncharacterized protein n=1 Tax=Haematococcus lacustris TaxID=44745 RepID=A0A699Y891_HAELA|nr:hypothetical protein HaLaN_01024 [Haematococcus lacustris]